MLLGVTSRGMDKGLIISIACGMKSVPSELSFKLLDSVLAINMIGNLTA